MCTCFFHLLSSVHNVNMPTPKSDFLSWDDDLNLDELLGEYTDYCVDDSDSEFEAGRSEKPQETPTELTGYVCPHCNKCLKTISGFRGHKAALPDVRLITKFIHLNELML